MTVLDLSFRDDSAVVTMASEGKFNPETLADFNAALDNVLARDGCTALIITGRDKHFAQGLDLDYLYKAEPEKAVAFVNSCMRMIGRLLQFPLPTVAAVNGHAFGLGCMITLACDYRVMRADRGYLCLPEIDLGMTLIPSMNALVTHALSGTLLRDMLLAGKRIGGEEARQRGLVDVACSDTELLEQALTTCAPMRGKDRKTLAGLKADLHRPVLDAIETAGAQ